MGRLFVLLPCLCACAMAATNRVPERFASIQAAIDGSRNDDTVLVGAGEYAIAAPITFRGKALTVRSAEGPHVTTIRLAAEPADANRASVCIFESGEDERSVLEGFTLTGGTGSAIGDDCTGGAAVLFGSDSSPTVKDCIMVKNAGYTVAGCDSSPTLIRCTIRDGMGLRFFGGSPVLDACTIIECRALMLGGGMYAKSCSPTLIECTIAGNRVDGAGAYHLGGGLAFLESDAHLIRCTIVGNRADAGGGVLAQGGTLVLEDCTIAENSSGYGGGLNLGDNVQATLINCTISRNLASTGGGLSVHASCALVNCVLSSNIGWEGSALYIDRFGSAALVNCTATMSFTTQAGGGVCGGTLAPSVVNSIFWGNRGGFLGGAVSPGSARVTYSCIEGGRVYPGAGNSNRDPRFETPGFWDDRGTADLDDDLAVEGDYHLRPGSPAIDAGTAAGAPHDDLEGNGRPCGAGIDVGAFERGGCGSDFVRGDANGEGRVDVADLISVLAYVFADGSEPPCRDAADANDDGTIDIADPILLLGHFFDGGAPLPAPSAACGPDPTDDALGCREYPPCDGQGRR